MKKSLALLVSAFIMLFSSTSLAYHIEVLQVGDITVFQESYEGFLDELVKNGIIEGKSLTINRQIIEAQADAGLWKKVGILLKIKKTAGEILKANPDLVLTIGTPATKYSKDKFIDAGIPVVFTAVANPLVVGCKSMDKAEKGFTGSTIYINPWDVIRIAQQALPNMKKMGMIHSDDDNAIAYAQETKEKGRSLDVDVITKEVEKSDDIKPVAMDLVAQGIDAFGIPIDSYYDLNNGKATQDLAGISRETKVPIIAFVTHTSLKGSLMYMGCDFKTVGGLAGKNAAQILINGTKPEDLPVLRQENITILVDVQVIKDLGVNIPIGILQLAKEI